MGYRVLEKETAEVETLRGASVEKQVARFLTPKASAYIRTVLEPMRESSAVLSPAHMEVIDLDAIWGRWKEDLCDEVPCDQYLVGGYKWLKRKRKNGNRETHRQYTVTHLSQRLGQTALMGRARCRFRTCYYKLSIGKDT
jgi:hypothetical protein